MEGSVRFNLFERDGLADIKELIKDLHEAYASIDLKEVPTSKEHYFRKKIRAQKPRIRVVNLLKISSFYIEPESFRLTFQMILSEISINREGIFAVKATIDLIKTDNEISAFYNIFHCLIVLVRERLKDYQKALEFIHSEFELRLSRDKSFYFQYSFRKIEKTSNFREYVILDERTNRLIYETIQNALRLARDAIDKRELNVKGEFQDKSENIEETFESLLPINDHKQIICDEYNIDIGWLDLD